MDKEHPTLSKYQEAYITMIATKTAKATGKEIEARLCPKIEDNKKQIKEDGKRINAVEKKVFNGIDLKFKHVNWKITFLFATYSVMIVIVIKQAFFG